MLRRYDISIVTINIYSYNKEKIFFILSNLKSNLLGIDLPKMDQHLRGKWLIHGPPKTQGQPLTVPETMMT